MSFKVHFLDVGQGDTSLVELPNGQFMLIDFNQTEEKTNIIDYLKKIIPKESEKYTLDYLVLTHPHKDHIRRLKDLIDDKEIIIGEIWESGHRTRDDDNDYRNYVDIMNSGKNVVKVKASSEPFRKFDGITIYIFAPSLYITEEDKDDPRAAIHNRCMVMKVKYNGKSVIFVGDSHYSCWEERIVPNYSDAKDTSIENLLDTDILSVSHHGSRTFFMDDEKDEPYLDGINKINPSICVISVGEDNTHKHPHKEAVDIYNDVSNFVCVTKDMGTIVVDIETMKINNKSENQKKTNSDIGPFKSPISSTGDLNTRRYG